VSVRSFRDVKRKVGTIFDRLAGLEAETKGVKESLAREKAVKARMWEEEVEMRRCGVERERRRGEKSPRRGYEGVRYLKGGY